MFMGGNYTGEYRWMPVIGSDRRALMIDVSIQFDPAKDVPVEADSDAPAEEDGDIPVEYGSESGEAYNYLSEDSDLGDPNDDVFVEDDNDPEEEEEEEEEDSEDGSALSLLSDGAGVDRKKPGQVGPSNYAIHSALVGTERNEFCIIAIHS
jgi:hypothetical protein